MLSGDPRAGAVMPQLATLQLQHTLDSVSAAEGGAESFASQRGHDGAICAYRSRVMNVQAKAEALRAAGSDIKGHLSWGAASPHPTHPRC